MPSIAERVLELMSNRSGWVLVSDLSSEIGGNYASTLRAVYSLSKSGKLESKLQAILDKRGRTVYAKTVRLRLRGPTLNTETKKEDGPTT